MTRKEMLGLTGRELDTAVLVEFHGWAWMQKIDAREPSGLDLWALIPPVGSPWERINWDDSQWRSGDTDWPKPYQRFTDWAGQGLLRGGGPPVIGMPHPTTDANAVRDMEAEIERRVAWQAYVIELAYAIDISDVGVAFLFSEKECFEMLTAPLETKCRAALLSAMTD